jgi:hypothetical protein
MRTRAEQLLDTYITIGRLIAGFALMGLLMVSRELGQFAGEAGQTFADVPFIVSSLMTSVGGYLSLGGELPLIGQVPLLGDLDPAGYAVFAFLIIGTAAAVKYND